MRIFKTLFISSTGLLMFGCERAEIESNLPPPEENKPLSAVGMAKAWYENNYLKSGHSLYNNDNLYIVWQEAVAIGCNVTVPCYVGENNSTEQAFDLKLFMLKDSSYVGRMVQQVYSGGDTLKLVYGLDKGLLSYRYLSAVDKINLKLNKSLSRVSGGMHEKSTTGYIVYLHQCPYDLVFDADLLTCNWESEVSPDRYYGYTSMFLEITDPDGNTSLRAYFEGSDAIVVGYDCTDFSYESKLTDMYFDNPSAFFITFGGGIDDAKTSIHNYTSSSADCEEAIEYFENEYNNWANELNPSDSGSGGEETGGSSAGGEISGGSSGGGSTVTPAPLPAVDATSLQSNAKANCIYTKLLNQGILANFISRYFTVPNPNQYPLGELNVTWTLGSTTETVPMNMLGNLTYNSVQIRLNETAINEHSATNVALSMLHEALHAKLIGEVYDQVGTTDFKTLYAYYNGWGEGNLDEQQELEMFSFYISEMASALREFDLSQGISNTVEFYEKAVRYDLLYEIYDVRSTENYPEYKQMIESSKTCN